ncbi:hypothetical protein HS125_03120 [bacterium]|nr:hypothetical protein [bacterium]
MYSRGRVAASLAERQEQREKLREQLLNQKRNAVFQEWLRKENRAASVVVRMRDLVEVTKDRKNVKVDLYRDQRREEEAA